MELEIELEFQFEIEMSRFFVIYFKIIIKSLILRILLLEKFYNFLKANRGNNEKLNFYKSHWYYTGVSYFGLIL